MILRYEGFSKFTEGTIPDFLHVSADSEEGEFIYESMVDEAQNFATVETLLFHYFSQDYFNRTDYLLEKCNSKWALEFELITLVSSQKSKLQHWAEKWDLLDPKILKEITQIGEMKNGLLVTKELFPLLHEWNAKHIYSLPVHNALAERQFNIASLYLDPNMSEESIQATQLFVQNIIHKKGAKKLRTTPKTREEYKTRMIAYTKTVNHELIASAKSALTDQKSGKAEHPAPLKAQEVAAGGWEGLKDKENATEIIKSLEEQGRNIEVRWQSSTIRDKRYEAERSFKPTFAEDLFNKDQVKSLRVICAAKIRRLADQIKIDELPYECQVLVKYLPKLLTENPNTQLRNENTNAAANSVEGSAKKRVLPSWMKPTTMKNGVVDTTTVIQDQTVV